MNFTLTVSQRGFLLRFDPYDFAKPWPAQMPLLPSAVRRPQPARVGGDQPPFPLRPSGGVRPLLPSSPRRGAASMRDHRRRVDADTQHGRVLAVGCPRVRRSVAVVVAQGVHGTQALLLLRRRRLWLWLRLGYHAGSASTAPGVRGGAHCCHCCYYCCCLRRSHHAVQ